MTDFKVINQDALARLPDLLFSLFPAGRVNGREFVVGSIAGEPGKSLSINVETGRWSDFATTDDDKGGDPVSLVAAVRGISQGDAAQWLAEWMGTTTRTTTRKASIVDTWKPTPTDTLPESIFHYEKGKPSATWPYRSRDGKINSIDCRFDPPGEKKEVLPYTHFTETATGKTKWMWKSLPAPRPLYGLDRLAQRPDAPVLFCEGCKAADAGQRLLPAVVCISWPGGCGAVDKADLAPITGRRVAIWPDNDEPGRKAAETLAQRCLEAGAGEVYIIEIPPGKFEGWDLADAEVEG